MFLCTVHVTACGPKKLAINLHGNINLSFIPYEDRATTRNIPATKTRHALISNRQLCYQDRSWEPSRSPMACKAQRRTMNVGSKQQTYQETQSNAIIKAKGCRYIIPVGRDAGQCRRQCNAISRLHPKPGPGGGHSGPFDTGASPSNGQAGGSATGPCHFSYASTAIIGAAFKAPPVQPLPGPFRPREQGDETPSILCGLYLYHSPNRQPVSTLIIVCQNIMLPLRAGCIPLHFGVRAGSIVPGEAR